MFRSPRTRAPSPRVKTRHHTDSHSSNGAVPFGFPPLSLETRGRSGGRVLATAVRARRSKLARTAVGQSARHLPSDRSLLTHASPRGLAGARWGKAWEVSYGSPSRYEQQRLSLIRP
jgi:hypothetical protein